MVNNYRAKNGLDKVTVVVDRSLNSYLNWKSYPHWALIILWLNPLTDCHLKLKHRFFDDSWDSITYDEEHSETFKVKIINTSTADNLINKIIVTWSSKRQAHDIKVLNERFEKAKALVEQCNGAINAVFKHDTRQFIKKKKDVKADEYETNIELYNKRIQAAGFYVLTTSKIQEDAASICHDLRQLWHIEECFRVMKTNLDTRPVYVWTTNSVKNHESDPSITGRKIGSIL